MSETKGDDIAATAAKGPAAAPAASTPERLSDLMASGAKAPAPATPDLEAEALRAAEAALAEGERALAAARAQLAPRQQQKRRSTSGREIALRLLLAANVLAMVVVASLPMPFVKDGAKDTVTNQPNQPAQPPTVAPVANESLGPVAPTPRLDDPYVQAIVAAERRDYAAAIKLLEHYLDASPRLAPGSQLNVLMMLAHYNQLVGKFDAAREYERRAQAIAQSHSLPEDLVAMAKAAQASGDQEALRRVWARFLLQQRQVPSSLFQHVAEAYLQLGDSYRNQANAAEERQRLRDLEAVNARVRAGVIDGGRK